MRTRLAKGKRKEGQDSVVMATPLFLFDWKCAWVIWPDNVLCESDNWANMLQSFCSQLFYRDVLVCFL